MKLRTRAEAGSSIYGRRRAEAAALTLDQTPIGMAWKRQLDAWDSVSAIDFGRIVGFLKKAPMIVKSGVPDPAMRLHADMDREADAYCYAIGRAIFAQAPSDAERSRHHTRESITRKVRRLRADFKSLGLSDLDLFLSFMNPENTDPLARKLREVFTINAELWLSVQRAANGEPGSGQSVLQWITRAKSREVNSARWDPKSPPRNEAMACLDAFICTLSNYFEDLPLDVARDCAIAAHPEKERGIRDRAKRHAARYGDRIRKRASYFWTDSELSPLFSSEVP